MTKEEPDEVLEPLFDYTRVQPINVFIDDDDDVVPLSFFPGGKRKRSHLLDFREGEEDKSRKVVIVSEDNNNNGKENEEDWMSLPPPLMPLIPNSTAREEDMILRELRLMKQELASIACPSKDMLTALVESVKRERHNSAKPDLVLDVDQPPKPERPKILISIQDKDGQKSFRMYTDDKLERLFKMYADKIKLKLETLIFCFDGEKLCPSATPTSAGLENDDIIEVHIKKSE